MTKKTLLSTPCCRLLLLLITLAGILPASAANTYEYHDDGTCTLLSVGSVTSAYIGGSIIHNNSTYTITAVDPQAFKDSPDLTTVSFQSTITSIPDGLFENCSKLAHVLFVNSQLNTIGARAFKGCSALTEIDIPATVTSIGDEAFQGCTGLKSIIIPGSVNSIGESAFSDCSSMTFISFRNNSRINIRPYAFYGCTNLEFVSFDGSTNYVSFDGNDNIFSESVYPSAILYCVDGETGVNVLANFKNIKDINDAPLRLKFRLASDIYGNITSAHLIGYEGYQPRGEIIIPAEYDGYPVVQIGGFKDCSFITSITIPESVSAIEGKAFSGCTQLTSVNIPAAVTSIGRSAFYGCPGLETIYYETENPISATADVFSSDTYSKAVLWTDAPSEKLTPMMPWGLFRHTDLISDPDVLIYSFDDATNTCTVTGYHRAPAYDENGKFLGNRILKGDIAIPSKKDGYTVTSIEINAFRYCKGLTSVSIPETITSFGNGSGTGSFYGCYDLTKVEYASFEAFWRMNFNSGLEQFSNGYNLWIDGKEVTEITIPDSLTEINNYAFYNCSSLKSVTIPNTVTKIGAGTFYGCTGLTSIDIPESVTSLGNDCFRSSGLTSLIIPESVKKFGNHVAAFCYSLESITFPETIASCMYRCCTGLKEIIIPNTVKKIESLAFSGRVSSPEAIMSTTYVSIPGSIEKFGESIFQTSPDITTVVYDTDSPIEAPTNIFDEEIYSQATLYTDCPAEKLADISPWNKFQSVKTMDQLPGHSDIELTPADDATDLPVEIYTLTGIRVSADRAPLTPGIYIERRGTTTRKIAIR